MMEESRSGTVGGGQEPVVEGGGGAGHVVHTRQLDYLYWQLDGLKQSMREKQSCLANVRYVIN